MYRSFVYLLLFLPLIQAKMIHLYANQAYSQDDLMCLYNNQYMDQVYIAAIAMRTGAVIPNANTSAIYQLTNKKPSIVLYLGFIKSQPDQDALLVYMALKKQIYKDIWIFYYSDKGDKPPNSCEYLTQFAVSLAKYTNFNVKMANHLVNCSVFSIILMDVQTQAFISCCHLMNLIMQGLLEDGAVQQFKGQIMLEYVIIILLVLQGQIDCSTKNYFNTFIGSLYKILSLSLLIIGFPIENYCSILLIRNLLKIFQQYYLFLHIQQIQKFFLYNL